MSIQLLKGETLTEVTETRDEITFKTESGKTFRMLHSQDCCENVEIEDIAGDIQELIGLPILEAYESSNSDEPPLDGEYPPESYTWTFYRLRTAGTTVVIRWYGTSNGYYSESVSFEEVTP